MDATNDIGRQCSVPLDCGAHFPRALPMITAKAVAQNMIPAMQPPFSGPRSAGTFLGPEQVCVAQPMNFLRSVKALPPTLVPFSMSPAPSASWGW